MEICKTCVERPYFLEPCPRCGNPGTFASHQERGFETCPGCNEKFCTDCNFGYRYDCRCVPQRETPPPIRLERQITEYKWEMAEEFMRQNPDLTEHTVYQIRDTIYKVIRRNGYLIRKQSSEHCLRCGTVDIRYPEDRTVYDMIGFICKKCISQG